MNVRLFGGIEVAFDDRADVKISAAKARWLLAFLALDVGNSRSVDSIIDALWHDRPPASAPNLVQGYVSDLRKIVGRALIRTTDTGYALVVDENAVDVVRFRQLTRTARGLASSAPEEARALVDQALAIGGATPFGEAAPDGALAAAAARLVEEQVDAAQLQADSLLSLGHHADAVALLDEATRRHPYREGLWATMAVALYRSDRQVDALRRLADARDVLQHDLGVSPGPRLVELEHQILEHSPALIAPVVLRTAPTNSPAVVGRADELARLQNRLHHASNGAHQTVFVGGEPGIGKTTLATAFSRTVTSAQTVVLTGRCDEHVASPYRPFIEAITGHLRAMGDEAALELTSQHFDAAVQIIPSLETLQPAESVGAMSSRATDMSVLERFDTFCWLLRRIQGDRSLVLVLEDLHWADSATLRLTHYLAAGHRLPRSLTIGTHRTTECSELLDDILADLRTVPEVERLTLVGLAERDLVQLMSSDGLEPDGELAGWIFRETDGNPFLVREIIDHVTRTGSREGVPVGVTEVVSRRLRRLSPDAQRLLEYAAVLGETGPISLLRRLAGTVTSVPDALAEAVRAGILAEEDLDEPRYRFAHAIVRKAATTGMTSLHLQDLHVAAAEAWGSVPRSDDAAMAMASHYLAAGAAASTGSAADAFIEAGAASDRTGAKVEAVQWYNRALEQLAEDDPRRATLRLQKFVAAQVAWHWLHGDYREPS